MAARRKAQSTKRKDPAALAAAVERVRAGESVTAVAKDLGWAWGTLNKAVQAAHVTRKAGIRQGKAVPVAANGNGASDNPFQIGITGLRDFIRHEVKALLPEVVAAEMTKRFGGGS